MKAIKLPKLEQGDLLYVTLTGSKLKKTFGTCKPHVGVGWLLITELSIDGEVIQANFCRQNQDGPHPGGYGATMWPEFTPHAFLRGAHGECSPFTAILSMFSKIAAIALT